MSITKGMQSVFTGQGLGAALAIFALLVVAAWLGYAPDQVANKIRS